MEEVIKKDNELLYKIKEFWSVDSLDKAQEIYNYMLAQDDLGYSNETENYLIDATGRDFINQEHINNFWTMIKNYMVSPDDKMQPFYYTMKYFKSDGWIRVGESCVNISSIENFYSRKANGVVVHLKSGKSLTDTRVLSEFIYEEILPKEHRFKTE